MTALTTEATTRPGRERPLVEDPSSETSRNSSGGGARGDSKLWRVADYEILRHRWDDEVVIYHAGSGDTLLLTKFGEMVLNTLVQGPWEADALVQAVAEKTGMAADMDLRFAVKGMLSRLHNHGIITRAR